MSNETNDGGATVPCISLLAESDYDSGLLNDYGGGNVGWWQDYIRAEVGRCNDYWRSQITQLADACPANNGVSGQLARKEPMTTPENADGQAVRSTPLLGASHDSRTTMEEFEKELTQLINRHSIENVADMPDFVLASMICRMVEAMGPSIKKTLDWHGCDSVCHPAPNAGGEGRAASARTSPPPCSARIGGSNDNG